MTYYEKLTKILGRQPHYGGLVANMKALNLKDLEDSAKNLFLGELKVPKQKQKAKKLGLI
ncbi:MAG: hypothetical protein LC122_00835 [Chitinophagales bacterium]|nr:hypothetical protein [Chitinophagales bacterium]